MFPAKLTVQAVRIDQISAPAVTITLLCTIILVWPHVLSTPMRLMIISEFKEYLTKFLMLSVSYILLQTVSIIILNFSFFFSVVLHVTHHVNLVLALERTNVLHADQVTLQ